QALRDEGTINGSSNIASNNSCADQRMRIDVGVTEKLAAMGLHLNQCTGWERGQGRISRVDLITEHPHVPGRDPPILAALKAQHRKGPMFGKNLRRGRNHLKLAAMAAMTAVIIRDTGCPIT